MSDVYVILQKPKGIQHEMYEIIAIATVYLAKTETILPENRDIDEDMAKITAGIIMTACAMARLPQAGDSWRSAQVGDPGQVSNARRSTQESPGQPSRCGKRDQREAA